MSVDVLCVRKVLVYIVEHNVTVTKNDYQKNECIIGADNSLVIFSVKKKLKLYKHIMHLSFLYIACSKNVIKNFDCSWPLSSIL